MKNKIKLSLKESEMGNRDNKLRRVMFYFIGVITPVFILLLFEFCLRLFDYGYDLTLFKKSVHYPGYNEVNIEVGRRYFTKFSATIPSNDIFLINKPDSCYRIFVMGCSTTLGFPYQNGTMFSRILNFRVQDVFPHKRIEFVNVAMTAINSFSLNDMIDEILQQKPDAILIYTGHNEYYGALGVGSVENGGNARWIKMVHLKLVRFRVYQLMQNSINSITRMFYSKSIDTRTLMQRIAKEKSIEYGSSVFKAGIEQFRLNISEIIEKSKNAGIPVILSEVVCNLHDQPPFKSLKSNNIPDADELFIKAKQYENKGDYSNAKASYYLAKDYDVVRFRAPEALNSAIHEIGDKYNIPVVPMKTVFENHSSNGIIGKNLMLEHLHPNINGYFLMADAFFNVMKKERLVSTNWDTTLIKTSDYYRNNWGFTSMDSLTGDIKIKMITNGWPFKPESEVNDFLFTYKPVSHEDSAAFFCVKNNTNIEDEHIELADYYSQSHNYIKAYNEYYSLIKCYPHMTSLYYSALDYLLAATEYKKAIDLLLSVPDKDTSSTLLCKLGEVFLRNKMPEKAAIYFVRAKKYSKNADDSKSILMQLFNAYKLAGDLNEERQTLIEIKSTDPSFNPFSVENKINEIKNINVKELIIKAQNLFAKKKFDEASELLMKSMKIEETGIANQMIGTIYFFKKDLRAIIYYEKAYNENPLDADVLNNLIILYLMKNDIPKATKCFNEFQLLSSDLQKNRRLHKYLENAIRKNMTKGN